MTGDKAPPAHPPYVTMIAVAIKSLKERTGSSNKAIGKYIGATYKVPVGFEKTLNTQLKRLAASGKLVRVKASFKLSDALKKEPKKVVKKTPVAKKPKAKTPKKAAVKKTTTTVKKATKPKAAKPTKPKAAKPKAAKLTKPKAAKPKAAKLTKPKAAKLTKPKA